MSDLDASAVYPNLYVGSCPRVGGVTRDHFDYLFLVADSCQDDRYAGSGVKVVKAPLSDNPLRPMHHREVALAARTGLQVAKLVHEGRRVLVACEAGLNRSALVAGLAMLRLGHMKPDAVVERIRRARGAEALHNASFVAVLRSYA